MVIIFPRDTSGKLLERMLNSCIQEAIRAVGDLVPRRCGFRRGTTTIDAVQNVFNAARTMDRAHRTRPVYLLATLDVRNVYNYVRWDKALETSKWESQVAEYLLRILGT